MMTIFRLINDMDRRIIFLVIAVAVIWTLVSPIGLPVMVTPLTQSTYDVIEKLQAGDQILLSFDYDPASEPELYPMAKAVVIHCFRKDVKIIALGLWAQGPMMAKRVFDELTVDKYDEITKTTKEAEFRNKIYGKDYINLGVKPSYIAAVKGMGTSFPATFPVDFNSNPVTKFEIMNGVNTYKDLEAIFSLTTGTVGITTYLTIAQAQYKIKVIGGCTAVSALEYYPYVQSKQLLGLLEGMKGASEYEALVKKPGVATAAMEPQSVIHIILILFIALANISQMVLKNQKL